MSSSTNRTNSKCVCLFFVSTSFVSMTAVVVYGAAVIYKSSVSSDEC